MIRVPAPQRKTRRSRSAHDRGVCEDNRRLSPVLRERALEPRKLLVVDEHLVAAVLGVAEAHGGEADEEVGAALARPEVVLPELLAPPLEVGCVGGEVLEALEVVVAWRERRGRVSGEGWLLLGGKGRGEEQRVMGVREAGMRSDL